jgi:hypothetical protein
MSPRFFFFACLFLLALAAGCGGKSDLAGDSGEAGGTCGPMPGCSSTTVCALPHCQECVCAGTEWACNRVYCDDAGSDADIAVMDGGPSVIDGGASIVMDGRAPSVMEGGVPTTMDGRAPNGMDGGAPTSMDGAPTGTATARCPDVPPTSSAACGAGLTCAWINKMGCAEGCTCSQDRWSCSVGGCPITCPFPTPPPSGSPCGVSGTGCFYPAAASCELECDCNPSGVFECFDVCDAGTVGTAGCPGTEPAEGAPCGLVTLVCSYVKEACSSNCLCTASGWVCAAQPGCSD